MIVIKTLLEDQKRENETMINEHGLSFYIEGEKESYLFDCSGSDKFMKNAERMGVELSNVKTVICSHSHFDHSYGVKEFLKENEINRFFTGKGFFEEKYGTDGIKYNYLGCGFDKNLLIKKGIEHIVCQDIYQLEEKIYIVGNFERKYEIETIPEKYVKRRVDSFIKDSFEDEIALVIDGEKGLTVICGCSHPGILNMLSTIKDRLKKDIYAVYGGTHLKRADDERLKFTVEEIKKMGVKVAGFSHCSGERIEEMLKKDMELETTHLVCGDCIFIK